MQSRAALWVLIEGIDGEREMTPIRLKIVCVREGRAETEHGGRDRISKTGFPENNVLRENRMGTYCSLEKSQSRISVVRKAQSFEKQLNIFSFNIWHLQGSSALCTLHSHTKRVKRYSMTSALASPINNYCVNIARNKLETNQIKYSFSSVEDQDGNKRILIIPWLSIGTETRKEYSWDLTTFVLCGRS